MEEQLNPAYVLGLTASNRLTDARGAVWTLLNVLPVCKQMAVIRIYNALCQVQGDLEKLREDVPRLVQMRTLLEAQSTLSHEITKHAFLLS